MFSVLMTLGTLFSLSSMAIISIGSFTMWEMSFRCVNSLKLMVRCRRAVRLEISFILLKLLPRRFSTWRFELLKIVHCEWRRKRLQNEVWSDEDRLLTVIWLRTLALATLKRILSFKLNNLGCGFRTGSMLRTFLSKMISLEGVSSLPVLCYWNSGCSRS